MCMSVHMHPHIECSYMFFMFGDHEHLLSPGSDIERLYDEESDQILKSNTIIV